MALDYHKCAQEISDNIGGGANVVSAAHCATRLRLVIADNGKVNKEALEEIDGVNQFPSGAIKIAELLGVDDELLREMKAARQEE